MTFSKKKIKIKKIKKIKKKKKKCVYFSSLQPMLIEHVPLMEMQEVLGSVQVRVTIGPNIQKTASLTHVSCVQLMGA